MVDNVGNKLSSNFEQGSAATLARRVEYRDVWNNLSGRAKLKKAPKRALFNLICPEFDMYFAADENLPWFSPYGHRYAMSNFSPGEIVDKFV